MSTSFELQTTEAEIIPGIMCRLRGTDGKVTDEYVVIALGSSARLARLGIIRWIAMAPAVDDANVPVVVGPFQEPKQIVPAKSADASIELLRHFAGSVAHSYAPAHADWAEGRLALADGAAPADIVELFQETCFVLGVYVVSDALPQPTPADFFFVGVDNQTQPLPCRIDWGNRSRLDRTLFIQGVSAVGPTAAEKRWIQIRARGRIRGFQNTEEMIEAFHLAQTALGEDLWPTSEPAREEIRAMLARLELMQLLSRRYYSDQPTQIRNKLILMRIGSDVGNILAAEIKCESEFVTPKPWKPEASVPFDQNRQSLNTNLMHSLTEAVRKGCGGKLRTCIDTGKEIHFYYESYAGSKRELQRELLQLVRLLPPVVPSPRDLYALSAFRSERVRGTVASIDGGAYGSEICTLWISGQYANLLVSEEIEPRIAWQSVALTRWVYPDRNIIHKCLRFVNMPHLSA